MDWRASLSDRKQSFADDHNNPASPPSEVLIAPFLFSLALALCNFFTSLLGCCKVIVVEDGLFYEFFMESVINFHFCDLGRKF
jgi:hypothetical protein